MAYGQRYCFQITERASDKWELMVWLSEHRGGHIFLGDLLDKVPYRSEENAVWAANKLESTPE
ncbi:hypothetical protein ACQPZJ_35495 [Actinoplanes sp. CA-054009]